MLTKEEVIEIKFICYKLGANTQDEVRDIVTKYVRAKQLKKININTVIATITNELM